MCKPGYKRRSSCLAEEEILTWEANSSKPKQLNNIPIDLHWYDLQDIEYFTRGGNSYVYTAFFNGIPVIVKTSKLSNEGDDMAALDIEKEMVILSKTNHPNIIKLYGAGYDSQGRRFIVLERLDGGTMEQMISTRKEKKRNLLTYAMFKNKLWMRDALRDVKSLASAMEYCHSGIDEYIIMHRDLKPDNIGYKSDGTLKIMDFGLAVMFDRTTMCPNEVYEMTGGTGTFRYMAPEVAKHLPYNSKAEIYSFGVILSELLSNKKPFAGLGMDEFFEKVVHAELRPTISNKWPNEANELMQQCWNSDINARPSFQEVILILDSISTNLDKKVPQKATLKLNIARSA